MPKRPADIAKSLDNLDNEEGFSENPIIFDADILYKNGNGILLFNDRKYAVGLTWLTSSEFEDDGSVYKKAKLISCDFYCSRAFVSQNGFGTLKLKHKMGMPSAAAMAADALVGEWHGVFAADNGWLYVAVHSDTIAPEGDLFFLSEEDAYNHFTTESQKYKWPKTYVPETWKVRDNDGEIEIIKILEEISSTSLKPANLSAFFGSTANKNLALLTILIVGGFLTLLFLSQSLFTRIIPEKAQPATQRLNISDSLAVPPREPVFEANPLDILLEKTVLPNPSSMMASCIENFDDLMVSIPGWNVKQMRCRGNFVEAVWQRGVGSLETLRSNIEQFPFGISKTYGSNGDFLASKIIPGLNSFDEPLKLTTREEALITLNNRFSSIGSIQVKDIVPKIENTNNNRNARKNELVAEKEEQMTLQNLPSLNVSLKTEISPMQIKENFNFPGLKFNMIQWSIENGIWLYDMQVYLFPENYKKDTI